LYHRDITSTIDKIEIRVLMSARARFLRFFVRTAINLLARTEARGVNNIPKSGPFIFATNHMSYVDPVLLYYYIGGEHITGWAADKYRKHIFGAIAKLGNPIFIRRGVVDRDALDAGVEALKSGLAFGLAPEGTRSTTGALIKAKTGISYLAEHSKAPIFIAAITGTEKAVSELKRLHRPHLKVRFSKSFHLPPLDPDDRTASMRRNADEVMCRMAAMLPPEYRGEYADHPRLAEFLEDEKS
jgi:1-acyl-sn-glycerol-3-phosphate acyltransferase